MAAFEFEFDASEVLALGKKMREAEPKMRRQADEMLREEVEQAAAEARVAAPKDRPWLGTDEGLQVVQKYPLTWSIISPYDPKGKSVGYRVVYGTSKMAPRDFISGPLQRAGDRFNRRALKMLEDSI